jgi:serine phosphatase RsbU (regulator of sigma subunit)
MNLLPGESKRPTDQVEPDERVGEGKRALEADRAFRAYEQEVCIQIQKALYPARAPLLSGFDIGGAAYPLNAVGGDYFDFIPMPDGSLGLVIGDACGHGVGAGLLMATTRAYLRAFAQTNVDVGAILGLVNRMGRPSRPSGPGTGSRPAHPSRWLPRRASSCGPSR